MKYPPQIAEAELLGAVTGLLAHASAITSAKMDQHQLRQGRSTSPEARRPATARPTTTASPTTTSTIPGAQLELRGVTPQEGKAVTSRTTPSLISRKLAQRIANAETSRDGTGVEPTGVTMTGQTSNTTAPSLMSRRLAAVQASPGATTEGINIHVGMSVSNTAATSLPAAPKSKLAQRLAAVTSSPPQPAVAIQLDEFDC